MKIKGLRWIVGVLVVGGVVVAMRGCLSKASPDEQLAGHFGKLCDIARDNVATPERGVRALGKYLGNHLGDVTGEFGATIAMIEKVSDDAKHDARARAARDRIRQPVVACQRDWSRFAEAVSQDEAASALVQHAAERLDRTFEILFGARTTLRDLPASLERAIDAI